jgi:hypothetical protein
MAAGLSALSSLGVAGAAMMRCRSGTLTNNAFAGATVPRPVRLAVPDQRCTTTRQSPSSKLERRGTRVALHPIRDAHLF